jgi:DNA polymerase
VPDALAELQLVAAEAATCTRCRLAEERTQVVFGTGTSEAALMFIGEGPGAEEDRQGLPFVGRSGRLLDQLLLEELALHRESVYIANVVKCRPPGNRDPLPIEIDTCRCCGGRLRINASIEQPEVIAKILSHLESTAPQQHQLERPLAWRAGVGARRDAGQGPRQR